MSRATSIPVIDAHIHLDLYEADEQEAILTSLVNENIAGLISVSVNLDSCQKQLQLKQRAPQHVYPAFGYHPEQEVPNEEALQQLTSWIRQHQNEMVAIGEVGLPYYRRKEHEKSGEAFDLQPYIQLLRHFVNLAVELDKPVVLHAIYEDADLACDILEECGATKAHFHWFRGRKDTLARMKKAGYYISITPDILQEAEVEAIARVYPLELMMVETDGPWKFTDEMTHPSHIRQSIERIADLKHRSVSQTAQTWLANTRRFYRVP
jgi:TatD DNase family protein